LCFFIFKKAKGAEGSTGDGAKVEESSGGGHLSFLQLRRWRISSEEGGGEYKCSEILMKAPRHKRAANEAKKSLEILLCLSWDTVRLIESR
jgi:hypothetical protein